MRIGIAGIGRMGTAIGERFIEQGHTILIWNRSPEKTKALAEKGAEVTKTPAELARAVDTVLTILTDAAAIDTVYSGPGGLLGTEVVGKLFIEMSTVPPDVEVALAEKVRARGARFVECPVSGTVGPARQGRLLGFVGAEPDDAERARPLLEQLCRRVEHCGPVGTGAVMKFTINLPLMIYWQALGEALAMSKPLNIDPARLIEILSDSSGGPNVLKVRGPGIVSMLKGGDPGAVTFTVSDGIKDIQAMLTEGKARGIDLPLLERTLAAFEEAQRSKSAGAEVSSVSIHWANRGT